ncbi:hypothetical protein NE172_06335 [Clostridium botulinum]|uniref:Uncharacterized protein n=1 Tax=Clostridium botulinum TaxID=1491 RepID=A0A6B4JKK2_CLOBO|nr:hypothetical protein [Clostridium botulinum]EES48504.1 hypothetical protein CLO_2541 [Clostridium botulinum E1 str. 'BoNT E Beluga']MBY6760780.1 hypothetical protein [Clostridium botulinum]MBY6919928.1 hypothetical protein [Clostridium botulinum]MCR1130566.1 hypothetical protein [Clostridium botulinum]NFJ57469.1 hypothetical protein [Clostridium botulinum]
MNKKELIMDMPVWDVRCWLQGLNEGEYLKVIKEGKVYTNADDLFDEIVIYGKYERSIEDGNILTVVYKNGEVITLEGIYKNILDQVKEDYERIKRHSEETKAYDLLNKLYKAVPEEFRDKINFSKKTIFFDDIALGTINDIKDIGCWNGKICGREDNETTEFDKFINIDKISSYRNIFFTYKDNGEYDCEIIKELEKGKIYGRNENGQVMEVLR